MVMLIISAIITSQESKKANSGIIRTRKSHKSLQYSDGDFMSRRGKEGLLCLRVVVFIRNRSDSTQTSQHD